MVLDSIRIISLDHPLPGRFPARLERFSHSYTVFRLDAQIVNQAMEVVYTLYAEGANHSRKRGALDMRV